MAMIKCEECGTDVSDRAASCPKCACPIAAPAGSVQTIEQTSKRYKAQQLLAALVLIVGVLIVIIGAAGENPNGVVYGTPVIIIGLIWFIVIRFLAWWHHG